MTTYETPGPLTLRLHLPAGSIDVRTGDGQTTTVEVEPARSGARGRAEADDVRQELRALPGGGQELLVEAPPRRGFGSSPSLRFRIDAPHGTTIDAETASADVRGQGRFGAVIVRTASGDIHVELVDADLEANTASGDVRADEVGGAATVRTVSGDVWVGRAAGRLQVSSVSGDLRAGEVSAGLSVNVVSGDAAVDALAGGSASLESVSGDLSIGIRRGLNVWLDLTSRSGRTTSDLDPSDGSAGEATMELRARSLSGDIHVHRERGGAEPASA
jgi:DUF4097 and DUF4098 domain-containing protein YvlB